MSIDALNLFDLADNDDYLGDSRRSAEAVDSDGGRVIALGHHGADVEPGETTSREAVAPQQPLRAPICGSVSSR